MGHLVIVLIIISVSMVTIPVFAQMESMIIDGPKYPFVNSLFNVKVIVDGISRASYGDFGVMVTLYEKESGEEIDGIVGYVQTGTNTVPINLKSYEDKIMAGSTYVLKVQHVTKIAEFEFIPVEIADDIPQEEISKIPKHETLEISPVQLIEEEEGSLQQEVESLREEVDELKKKLDEKEAVLMEQLRVIQNLASMVKTTIFEPIYNFFSFV